MKRIATNDQIDDRGAKRAKAVGSPPASWEDMTQWMNKYDSVSESGQAISTIWSNTEANPSKTMKQVREIVCPMKSGAYDSEEPDEVRAAKYKSTRGSSTPSSTSSLERCRCLTTWWR